mgnify:CR=1 FL=1
MDFEREKLFNLIKQRLPSNISFIGEIADILDISYDATYRRLNGKTALSFAEAIKLAKYFKISLNSLYSIQEEENLFVLKRSNNNSLKGLTTYFDVITKSTDLFTKFKSPSIIYAAKDIPLYYLPENTLYTKFKLLIFSSVHTDDELKHKIKLKDFTPTECLIRSVNDFNSVFKNTITTEIWNDTTINGTLYQIYYFYELKLLNKNEAIQLCYELEEIIRKIEYQAIHGIKKGNSSKKYNLYYNRLINLNNTVFLKSEKLKTLIIPYTALSYLRIDDEQTCEEIELYLQKQLQFSIHLSGDTEVERQLFFSTMYEKIEQLKEQITIKSKISFM